MYFKILLAYILGYVNIEVEGYFIERFINICNSKKIFLWNMKRKHSTIIRVNIGIRDFKKIKEIAKKTKCRVKIQKKRGIPFILHKYKKRKIFAIFFILLIIAVIALSNFVWNIEVIGNNKISAEEIIKDLADDNFKVGTSKTNLNTKNIIDKIRLKRSDLAWIGIEIKGTNAIVKIVEADLKPDIIKEEEYCNIVATKDAMIVKINAQNGTAVVKEGDIVTKGTVLIQGWLEGQFTGIRYVHANGEVQAKVWYSQKISVPLKQTKKIKTDKEENKYSVKINNFEINLPKGVPKFQNYDTIETSKKLKLFSDFYLPIEIHQKTYQEYEEQEITYSIEEAKELGIAQADESLKEQIEGKQVTNKKINAEQIGANIEVEVIYEVLESIGTKEKIIF